MRAGVASSLIGSPWASVSRAPGCAIRGHEGTVKMFTQALLGRSGAGHTINNVQPGPIDTELNPRSGDWGLPQKAATASALRACRRVSALVSFVAGPRIFVHHRRESHRRWRNECLNRKGCGMTHPFQERNKKLVLEAFDTLFNKTRLRGGRTFGRQVYSNTMHTSTGRKACST